MLRTRLGRWACVVVGLAMGSMLFFDRVQGDDNPAAQTKESPAERAARMQWWRDARFGMFIHWGVYSVPAGTYKGQTFDHIGEWIMLDGKIPVAEYREYARDFNPVKYDPARWARLAKDAGMKYIIITSKHHDGFAMFPSDATDWDVADATPYGKDLIGPLAEAAREEGLKFGLYYSQAQDWVHPGGAKAHGHKSHKGWDKAHNGDFDAYLDGVAVPQVREILTRYQPDVLWWDTPVEMNAKRAAKLVPLLALKPGIITNDRLQRPDQPGDFGTPEQEIPDTGLDRDWETCMTMNKTWGYKSYDHNWKSAETLIRNLVEAASKGGNYLLNIGPKSDGTIPEESIERLEAIGRWMKVNGESIYGTVSSPIERPKWGRITTKRGEGSTTLYLHVFDWPADGKLPVALDNEVEECRLLADPERKLTVDRDNRQGHVVHLTGERPDSICSVVRLKIVGDPVTAEPPQTTGTEQ
jgi:alpha-L-fucosidase